MRQYALLDFHGGCWHLITGNAPGRDRKWTNRHLALSDLISEGWILDGSDGRQPTAKHDANRHFYGYELRRTIH